MYDNYNFVFQLRNLIKNYDSQFETGGKASIEVCYSELAQGEQTLAFFLPETPQELLKILDQGLKDVVGVLYKNYKEVKQDFHIRISNLPLLENIRTLRQLHLNQMVRKYLKYYLNSIEFQIYISALHRFVSLALSPHPREYSHNFPSPHLTALTVALYLVLSFKRRMLKLNRQLVSSVRETAHFH